MQARNDADITRCSTAACAGKKHRAGCSANPPRTTQDEGAGVAVEAEELFSAASSRG